MKDFSTIDSFELQKLRQHSMMLGQIGSYVEEFCRNEEYSTLDAVLCLLSEYYQLKADLICSKIKN